MDRGDWQAIVQGVAKSQTHQSMSTMITKRWKQGDKLVGSNNNKCFSFFPFVIPTSVSTWALKSALYSYSQPLFWTIWIRNLPLRFNQTLFLCHTLSLFLLTNFSSQPHCWLWKVRAGSAIKSYLATMLCWMMFVTWAVVPIHLTSLVAQTVKHLPTMQETWVQSVGQEDLLEKEMATHSSILAWKIPWTEEPGRLQSMG